MLAVVAVWTGAAALEERYVFYVYAPLAIVASVRHLPRMLPDLVVAGAVVVFAMAEGGAFAGSNLGNFFAAPAGAFWTRVVDHRLRAVENDVLGVLPGAGGGWLLIAIGVAALVVVAFLSGRRARLRSLVAVGLALCALAQVLVLQYDYDKLLYGTPEAPGGFALADGRSLDQEDWIDDALPDGAHAAIVPAVASTQSPYGDTERQQFWNKSLDASVVIRFAFVPTSVPAGFKTIDAALQDGLATWEGPSYDWVVAQPGDPRVQYSGTEVTRSDSAPLGLFKLDLPQRAVWTRRRRYGRRRARGRSDGADAGPRGGRRRAPRHARTPRPRRTAGRRAVDHRAVPAMTGSPLERSPRVPTPSVRLRASRCAGRCMANDVWRLTTAGATAQLQPPFLGTPPPPRPVRLFLSVGGARALSPAIRPRRVTPRTRGVRHNGPRMRRLTRSPSRRASTARSPSSR